MSPIPFLRSYPVQRLLLLAAILLGNLALAQAQPYEISVTRLGNNVYRIDNKALVIQTEACQVRAYAEAASLKSPGSGGDLFFAYSREFCAVRHVYGAAPQSVGRFAVTVSQKADNWYEIFGSSNFIRTQDCRLRVLADQAYAQFGDSGQGELRFNDGSKCSIEAMYSRVKLQ